MLTFNIKRKFWDQRQSARQRKIEWNLTLEQWWGIWEQSGHWPDRGVHRGQYCMSRIGDTGAYEIGNVFIQLHCNNIRDAHLGKKDGPRSKDVLDKIRPGGQRPKLTSQQVLDIQHEYKQKFPFAWGTKMKWLDIVAKRYNVTQSLVEKITSDRCAKWY